MASKREIAREKRELTSRLDGLRGSLGRDRRSLVRTLNPLRRFGSQLRRQPLRTFGIACLGSAVVTMVLRRTRRPRKKKRTTVSSALSAALLAGFQPALKHWVAYMVKQQLSSRAKTQSPDSLLGP